MEHQRDVVALRVARDGERPGTDEVAVGDVVVAEDAVAAEGEATIDESVITGEPIPEPAFRGGRRLEDGPYLATIGATVQLYLRLDGPVTIDSDTAADEVQITFPRPGRVHLGFRSFVRGSGISA